MSFELKIGRMIIFTVFIIISIAVGPQQVKHSFHLLLGAGQLDHDLVTADVHDSGAKDVNKLEDLATPADRSVNAN